MPARPRHSASSDAGFTLVENMVALAILGTSLFVLLEMHYSAVNAQSRLDQEVRVRNLISQAVGIAEVEIAAGTLKDSQEFGDRFPGWTYSFEAEPVDATSSNTTSTSVSSYPGLHNVLVTVEDPDGALHELYFYAMVRVTPDGEVADDEGGEEAPPPADGGGA